MKLTDEQLGWSVDRISDAVRSALGGRAIVGETILIGATAGCWTANALGGGIAAPVCWGVTGAAFAYGVCLMAQWLLLWDEKHYSEACCCTTLQCRNTGQSNCPNISTCDMPHTYCGNVSCVPLF